jgi:hypothetical protein
MSIQQISVVSHLNDSPDHDTVEVLWVERRADHGNFRAHGQPLRGHPQDRFIERTIHVQQSGVAVRVFGHSDNLIVLTVYRRDV